MRPIGGYFELELQMNDEHIHSTCSHLNSGRHALEYIILNRDKKPNLIWLPYYTCDVVLQPLKRQNIDYKFYHVNENLEIPDFPQLNEEELIIVNNYFGIKDDYINYLVSIYRNKIIIDCAQAFYMPEELGVMMFYSPRKFFGIPDGGMALVPIDKGLKLDTDQSFDRCGNLLMRLDGEVGLGYDEFKKNSARISNSPLKRMSRLTSRMLRGIDYDFVRIKRLDNYRILRDALEKENLLSTPLIKNISCPMVYPYRTKDTGLRQRLIENQIYVATYWPNVKKWCSCVDVEYKLTDEIIPLPIDQRYNKDDMLRIISIIKQI